MNYSSALNTKIRNYYNQYYNKSLGIPNAEELVANRLSEESQIITTLNKVAEICGVKYRKDLSVFVGGAGTGGEIIVLKSLGCEVLGVEPNPEAVEIAKMKLTENSLNPDLIIKNTLENTDSYNDSFDFVYCWTVLEHVQNVEKAIQTLIRVCKPGGVIFIGTPDYRFCYEGHYKLPLPMFLPKFIIKFFLFLLRRPTSFLDSLQFVTSKQIRNILKRSNVIALQANLPYPPSLMNGTHLLERLHRFYSDELEIQKDQYWVIRKLP